MIYSANYGSWDPPRPNAAPVTLFTERDYPLATTARYMKPYQPISHSHPQPNATQNRLDAKWWKCRPDLALPGEPVTIWVDSSVTILRPDFAELCLAELGDDDALFMPHPWRDCIYAEAEASLAAELDHKYGGMPVREQMAAYRAAGHPEHWGLIQSTVLIRRDNARTRTLNDMWWNEITQWTIQDQVSLPYLLRKLTKRRLRWHYWPVNPIAAGWLAWGMYNA